MSHQYESVNAARQTPPIGVSSRWKALAYVFAALQLLGYMILAIVVGDPSHKHFNTTASTICAFIFIGASCCGLFSIAGVKWQQRHFLIHTLFIPYSVVNILALINVLLHIASGGLFLSPLRVVGICLPAVFSVFSAVAAGLIYREHREEGSTPPPSEEEMQRRQLLRLLEEQGSNPPSPELIRNTYRFDLPDEAQNNWKPAP